MVGKDKIWNGEVNRHLAREKNLNFWEKKAPPTKRTKWNEFIRMYLDGVKYVNIHYWKIFEHYSIFILPKKAVNNDTASWKISLYHVPVDAKQSSLIR